MTVRHSNANDEPNILLLLNKEAYKCRTEWKLLTESYTKSHLQKLYLCLWIKNTLEYRLTCTASTSKIKPKS